jgi:uncharacterized OB-fold protein
MKPQANWRQNKDWPNRLGQIGKVIASTFIRVAPEGREAFAPYSFVLVELENCERLELMGVPGEELQTGDQVKLVLRRIEEPDESGVIAYGLKAEKI